MPCAVNRPQRGARTTTHNNGVLPLTEEIINAVPDPERLERPVRAEIDCLGKIAVDLANNGKVEFLDTDIQIAIRELEAKTNIPLPHALEYNIQKLSVLSVESTHGETRYTFLHLTVQEFSMATHLVHNPGLIKEHISKHKYSQRYQSIWRFVAGLLPTKDDLVAFFDLLQQEPRDLVGKNLAYILMHCLGERESHLDKTCRDRIHEMLSDWLSFEVHSKFGCSMINSNALPDSIFVKALHYADQWPFNYLYPKYHRTDLSEFLCDRLISCLDDHWEVD
ncbi:hypothetical protein EDB80DRAFT_865141 [Ilyonectria destructans]|nr:hypothetical protein EDB80DRAFT_865141 [Ilyonectria destructans]